MNPIYTVRAFPSATGHRYFQVMGPNGRVYESLDYDKAQSEADYRNAALAQPRASRK